MEVQCGAAGGEAGVKKPVGPAQVVCARLVFLEHSRDVALSYLLRCLLQYLFKDKL